MSDWLLIGQEPPDLAAERGRGMVTTLSQLTTLGRSSPLRDPTGISVESPRAVLVIGATVTRLR